MFRFHRHNRRLYHDPNAQLVKWMKLIQWDLVSHAPKAFLCFGAGEGFAVVGDGLPY
jgi:hypothetical protein